jgi:hypothetical protein
MSRTLQFKRYDAATVANTIGANGELIIDSTNQTLTIHDGRTRGGNLVGGSGSANTGNIAFSGTTMSGPTGSSDGYSVYIQPSADFTNTLQILPTADNDIHLFEKSGNAITLGTYGESQITVNGPASANADITVQSAGSTWTFGNNGQLTFPNGAAIANIQSFGAGLSSFFGDPTGATFGTGAGNDITFFDGNAQLYANNNLWQFAANGELYLPTGGRLGVAGKGWTGLDGGNGNPLSLTSYYASEMYSSCITLGQDGSLNISTYGDGTGQTGNWIFSGNNLTFSDNTNQTTAWTGEIDITQNTQIEIATSLAQASFDKANTCITAGQINGDVQINGNLLVTYGETVVNNMSANNIIVETTLYSGLATRQATPLPNLIAQFTSNSSTYVQVNSQNINPNGSADFVVTADVGTDTDYYIDIGIAGSQYNYYQSNTTTFVPLDGYLLVQGSTIDQAGGNLIIGTTGTLGSLHTKFIVGGTDEDNVVMRIKTDGVYVEKDLTVIGNITGNVVLPGPFTDDADAATNSVGIHTPYFTANGAVYVRMS